MEAIYLDVIHSDGTNRRHTLSTEQVTVGRGTEADISLPGAPELEELHLLVEARDDGCWVSAAREAEVQPRRNGRVFENGLLPWGAELDLGTVMFTLVRETDSTSRGLRLRRHVRKLAMVVALLWMMAVIFLDPPNPLPQTNANAPALFELVESSCPGRKEEAAGRASEAVTAATAKAERYPFAPRDGVQSVVLFARAGACLARAGDTDTSEWAREQQAEMSARVDEDYRVYRIRLDRALERRRYGEALREVRRVSDFLRGFEGEYVDWLARLDRALVARVDGESK